MALHLANYTDEEEYLKRAMAIPATSRGRFGLPGRQRNRSFMRTNNNGSKRQLMRSLSAKGSEMLARMSRQSSDDDSLGSSDDSSTTSCLSYTQADIAGIIDDDEAFRNLKSLMKEQGCVTSSSLRQSVNHCVNQVKDLNGGEL